MHPPASAPTTRQRDSPISLQRYSPGLHVAEDSQVVVVASDSLLNLLNEETKLHEDHQTRHGQPDVTEDLRETRKKEFTCPDNKTINI